MAAVNFYEVLSDTEEEQSTEPKAAEEKGEHTSVAPPPQSNVSPVSQAQETSSSVQPNQEEPQDFSSKTSHQVLTEPDMTCLPSVMCVCVCNLISGASALAHYVIPITGSAALAPRCLLLLRN